MRAIAKGKEPNCLAECRSIPGTNFNSLDGGCKNELRKSLVSEQRGICCFCMSRIRPEYDAMKIAHWRAQSLDPELHAKEDLHYPNLLGACLGNEGQPRQFQHCDTHQANEILSKNPANPLHRVEESVRYSSDGTIISTDEQLNRDLTETLNLNIAFLKNNRQATLDGFLESLPKQGVLGKGILDKWMRDWNGESHSNDLRPFCQVIVYWLRKRIARA